MLILYHFKENYASIFNNFFLSTLFLPRGSTKNITVNSDSVIKILNQKIEDDQRLSISYQLHSFNIDKNEASYIKFDSMKKRDTLIIKHSGEKIPGFRQIFILIKLPMLEKDSMLLEIQSQNIILLINNLVINSGS